MSQSLEDRDADIRQLRAAVQAAEGSKLERIADVIPISVARFPVPRKGLMTDEQAEALRRAKRSSSDLEQRLEFLRRSGIARHLGRDRDGVSDVDRVVRDQCSPTPALEFLRRIVGDGSETRPRRWVLIAGGTGIGKTVAAAWLLARYGGRYTTIHELVDLHRSLARGLAPQTQDEIEARLERLVTARVVVLDEVGQETDHTATRHALHWWVERRASAQPRDGWTVIITNKDAAEIRRKFMSQARDAYDPRTESRLRPLLVRRKDGSGIHELPGTDMRGEAI